MNHISERVIGYAKRQWQLFRKSLMRQVIGAAALCLFAVLVLKIFGVVPPSAGPVGSSVSRVSIFYDPFGTNGTLYETAAIDDSRSPYWWLNSGAKMIINDGVATTVEGALDSGDPWFRSYAKDNPTDTDGGRHPQNIFRLVTKDSWLDYIQEAYFKIDALNLSSSPNRNESNGLLLFNRYQDGDNLYYAGIRVDGAAVIKKKIHGIYYQMAYHSVFPGKYDRAKAPNLLPTNTWIGLRTIVYNDTSGGATVKLYIDIGKTGNWTLAASASDDGSGIGGAPIMASGHAGIRTDFMDVEFDDFKVTRI